MARGKVRSGLKVRGFKGIMNLYIRCSLIVFLLACDGGDDGSGGLGPAPDTAPPAPEDQNVPDTMDATMMQVDMGPVEPMGDVGVEEIVDSGPIPVVPDAADDDLDDDGIPDVAAGHDTVLIEATIGFMVPRCERTVEHAATAAEMREHNEKVKERGCQERRKAMDIRLHESRGTPLSPPETRFLLLLLHHH